MITKANRDGLLSRVPTSKGGPILSHLFFTDDNLLFCRSNVVQWNQLSSILHAYEVASGQKMNTNKMGIFFSRNTTTDDKKHVQELAGIPVDQCYDKYVGLPALVGRLRTKAFKHIKERVEASQRLEAQVLISSRKRDFVESNDPGNTDVLYESLQATKGAMFRNKFSNDEILLGPQSEGETDPLDELEQDGYF